MINILKSYVNEYALLKAEVNKISKLFTQFHLYRRDQKRKDRLCKVLFDKYKV